MSPTFFFDVLRYDVRTAIRSLRRRPAFTAIVVLSLALGIGANAAIFSVVDAILLRPLPVPDARNLVALDTAASRLTQFGGSSYLDYIDFRNRSKSFEGLTVYQQISAGMNVADAVPGAKPEVVWGLLVSGNFFSTLKVQPALGRDFLPAEDEVPGKFPVVMISHGLWARVFNSDPKIAGKIIKLSGHPFTIIGVSPKSFSGPDLFSHPDVYVPTMMSAGLAHDGADTLTHRSYRAFDMLGRLNPGVTVAQAQAEMDTIMRDLERQYPDTNKDNVVFVRNEMARRTLGNNLLMPSVLMGLVILVLLIACANVASLMMAKATSRIREISTQLAIGASRTTLIRQFLTESAVLALLGGCAGILLAYGCTRAFASMLPVRPQNPEFRLDLRVVGWATLAALAAVFLCGIAPAFTAVREAWGAVVARTSVAGNSFSALARRVLIAGQVALSAILLITGGLFLKAFVRAQNVDLGFNPNHVLAVTLDPSLSGYSNEQSTRFHEQLAQRLGERNDVASVSYATYVPFISGNSWDLSIDGYIAPDGEKFLDVANSAVAPQYFATMQIPILRGREFDQHDTHKGTPVAIVNETLARRYIVPTGDVDAAIGHVIRLREGFPIQIVGIAKDSNYGNIGTPPIPVFYTPYQQEGGSAATFTIRTKGDPTALASDVRREIASIDPGLSSTLVSSLSAQVSSQGLFFPRIITVMCGAFGLVALLLAAIGIYGVVSFMVARRTHEIGIRMALGAPRSSVLRIVLTSGVSLAATGMVIGIAGSFGLTPLVRSMLIGVSPWDPVTFVVIAALMLLVTVLASLVPARRATHVEPIDALHYE